LNANAKRIAVEPHMVLSHLRSCGATKHAGEIGASEILTIRLEPPGREMCRTIIEVSPTIRRNGGVPAPSGRTHTQ